MTEASTNGMTANGSTPAPDAGKQVEFRTVRLRKRETDPDSVAPRFWEGSRRRSPPGIADNVIRTTKYTILTFFPKNLFEQFRRLFNVYWLIQCVVVLIPGFSPVSPYSTIGGFVFVLGVTCIKDAYEDYQRFVADKEANGLPVQVLRDGDFHPTASKNLLVGDVVRVMKDEPFPADLAVISSSDPQNVCYVETSNLDGERNLKRCYPMGPICEFKEASHITAKLQCTVLVEPPNERLYRFIGQLRYTPPPEEGGQEIVSPVNAENVCLRGARLKQTDHIIGTVVYAGMETKLSMNSRISRSKFSQVEKHLNTYIVYLFAIDIAICIGLTAGTLGVFESTKNKWYLALSNQTLASQLVNVFSFFVILSSFIPLSLMVSLEIASFAQALFMTWDDDMKTSRGPMKVMSSALNAELGQVEYVFCDKTGTLTQNRMVFRHASVLGREYLDPMNKQLSLGMEESGAMKPQYEGLYEYLRVLALCNDVIPEYPDNQSTVEDHEANLFTVPGPLPAGVPSSLIRFNSASPDEVALVLAAAANKMILVKRDSNGATLLERGELQVYETLATFDFTSERRRMSSLIRSPKGTLLLLTKGADQVMIPLCEATTPRGIMSESLAHMEHFASQGHRVMLVSMKVVDPDEYALFSHAHAAAAAAMDDRIGKMEAAYAMLEKDLLCLGVTCVEDKLQDRVPETVQYLLGAGMHVWILTGDKLETAMTIAYSSSIIDSTMALALVEANDWPNVLPQIHAALALQPLSGGKALIIGGTALALAREHAVADLVRLCRDCNVVVCARCAPVQKSEMVQLVIDNLHKITLSIGDGGNDVPMIKTAHIGVGIMGNEGMQAARSSDFAIGEYRLLKKLLAVHGRYSSLRTTDLIKYSFFKNVCFCLPQILFSFWNLFSASSIFNSWVILGYNVIFTGMPPLVLAVFDKDLPEYVIDRYPELYCTPERRQPLTVWSLVYWEGHALWQGLVAMLACLYATSDISAFDPDGRSPSLDTTGFVMAEAVVIAVSIHMGLLIRHWTVLNHAWLYLCVFGFYLTVLILDSLFCPGRTEPIPGCGIAIQQVLGRLRSWAAVAVTVGICQVPNTVILYWLRQTRPEAWQVLQEVWVKQGKEALDALDPARSRPPQQSKLSPSSPIPPPAV